MMLKIPVLIVGALLLGELVRLGVNRWFVGRISDIAGLAVAVFVILTVVRHPGFGWSEAPMGTWDVGLIVVVSLLAVTLSQFVKGLLFRRAFERSTPGGAQSG
jgi:hypothetical protein